MRHQKRAQAALRHAASQQLAPACVSVLHKTKRGDHPSPRFPVLLEDFVPRPGLARQNARGQEEEQFLRLYVHIGALERWPITGKLPTSGTSWMDTFCWLTIMPPMTTVPPSATRTFVSADCVSSAGIPCTRGMPLSICVFSTSTSMNTVPSAVICGVTSSFKTASMNCTEMVLLMVV